MDMQNASRRDALAIALGAGLASPWALQGAFAAAAATTTGPVETNLGKVRGQRAGGVSVFKGIPFGTDTGKHRFQPARAANSWTGVRDCFVRGPQAPQILGSPPLDGSEKSPVAKAVAAWMRGASFASNAIPQSEDCLSLNVFTPDASPRGKRPVMVWLHGGGYTTGAGSLDLYDGSNLCRRGDVVVVSINHRLGALGFLYLGALHDDFADSGMVGHLDQVLALQWVRDNIAAFGGDPGNVTIFGESGGGFKVSVMMGMPPAKGLFHKGIIESGAGLKGTDRATAADVAEKTLAALGVAKADVHKLQTMDRDAILKAMRGATGPVVDGRSLPAHPFDPKASELAAGVPIIIGTNKDEPLLNMAMRPDFGAMTAEEARKQFDTRLGGKSAQVFELYRAMMPNDAPMYWAARMQSDASTWINSIRLAERKAAQKPPVYMYRFDWASPVAGGAFKSPHGFEVGLALDNSQLPGQRDILGTGPATLKMAAIMSQAWVNFARTGNPSQKGLAWTPYDAATRRTMIFDTNSRMVADPNRDKRELWAGMA